VTDKGRTCYNSETKFRYKQDKALGWSSKDDGIGTTFHQAQILLSPTASNGTGLSTWRI
jgi:hypothetical protein